MYFANGYDDNDAGPGMIGKWNDHQLPSMNDWARVGDREPVAAACATVHSAPAGASRVTEINQLMPLELEWLAVPGSAAPTVPAGRW